MVCCAGWVNAPAVRAGQWRQCGYAWLRLHMIASLGGREVGAVLCGKRSCLPLV